MIVTYIATLIPLIVIDGIWLMLMAKTFYAERIGHLMATQPTWWPILLFYPLYAAGLTLFVLTPENQTSLAKVALMGACFGCVAYATYDLTNHATLKNWPIAVTALDIAWGACVGACVCVIATILTKYFAS